ncbi:aspartyl-phosphate phosphatase Spo0E family protein [Halobacillus andaensis]|uniref:aspartyl-phosphate phosphatase Spo0E family protein n=1 Tax=Halobacillus andaensis TaxID=1176239 RepID=UPI00227A1910|nr:aspartyl-phosphate phosphatase Spo0E family protein [Halobacillus andaensis]
MSPLDHLEKGYIVTIGGVRITIKQLEERIEQLRLEMYKAFLENPQDPQVVEISQSLDELLNEYNRLTKK